MQTTQQAPTPFTSSNGAPQHLISQVATAKQWTSEGCLAAKMAKREQWATLDLRQTWADEALMRDHLRAARLRVTCNLEPATVKRLRSLLRRAGLLESDVRACVGTNLTGYLKKNPRLPLWAALALILEASGGYTFGLKSYRRMAAETMGEVPADLTPSGPPAVLH